MNAALLLVVAMAAATSPSASQPRRPPAAGPIAIEIGNPGGNREGLLDMLFAIDEDGLVAERGLADALGERPWLRLVRDEGEAAIAVGRGHRSVSSRSRSKDGKRTTITFRYYLSAGIAIRGERDSIEVESFVSRTYANGSGRMDPTRSEDHEAFRQAGRELAKKASAWLLPRLVVLRPDGPDAGFRHRTRFKLLLKGDGLEVLDVLPNGPADRAGLRPGDRIRRIDAEDGTVQMDERVYAFRLDPPGTRVALDVERDRQRRFVTLVLEGRPILDDRLSPWNRRDDSARSRR